MFVRSVIGVEVRKERDELLWLSYLYEEQHVLVKLGISFSTRIRFVVNRVICGWIVFVVSVDVVRKSPSKTDCGWVVLWSGSICPLKRLI